ncbi:MAG: 5,6-dimethylbenzimidazole synthase [Herminiimonas sp.]|uniref:5,6-dimethylbenzimidazole synthase n=1 Tax=Herminiimonas sp. TaxID=1926289 RepID=UPI0027220FD2|nr:5,6-dimethylbenzimidazole synthase [Herminiimonas sp.]MDO9420373.1 5,6-dimethylbenzimidazole synthase [Herminiimonas sp.]
MDTNKFSNEEIAAVYKAIQERRDMRHFLATPLEEGQLERLVKAAHMAPSVGLMQPWRFIRITDFQLRTAIQKHVEEERIATADALDERSSEFMRLKVEGILSCAEVLVVGLMDQREKYIFGRRTMPEMDLASASCAIQNMWLAARAEGIGLGWVSLFDPEKLRELCQMPEGSQPIAILCLGHVKDFYPAPMLEIEEWDKRKAVSEIFYENSWDASKS